MSRSPITCHILDTTLGKPAKEVNCAIYRLTSPTDTEGEFKFGLLSTNDDGRIVNWVLDPSLKTQPDNNLGISSDLQSWDLQKGIYKIRFQTSKYFKQINDTSRTFFPFVDIIFQVDDPSQHYHVPLLLSNHSYTTYRGS